MQHKEQSLFEYLTYTPSLLQSILQHLPTIQVFMLKRTCKFFYQTITQRMDCWFHPFPISIQEDYQRVSIQNTLICIEIVTPFLMEWNLFYEVVVGFQWIEQKKFTVRSKNNRDVCYELDFERKEEYFPRMNNETLQLSFKNTHPSLPLIERIITCFKQDLMNPSTILSLHQLLFIIYFKEKNSNRRLQNHILFPSIIYPSQKPFVLREDSDSQVAIENPRFATNYSSCFLEIDFGGGWWTIGGKEELIAKSEIFVEEGKILYRATKIYYNKRRGRQLS